jgi:hypothetical protein
MRLPIKDEWKPLANNSSAEENSYEEHVKTLAERLREANKVDGHHCKTSHETAKRYYDKLS